MDTLQNSFEDSAPSADITGTVPRRIDAHYIKEEVAHLLHLEKGFFYTVKELAIRPGKTMRTFLFENRNRYTKPVIFLIVTSLIYTIIVGYLRIDERVMTGKGDTYASFLTWVQKNYGYANILMGFFITLWTGLLFRKHRFNFFEISVLVCYVMGQCMMLFSAEALFRGVTRSSGGTSQLLILIVLLVYTGWAIGQSFEKKTVNYLKGGLAYFLGTVSFYVVAAGISMFYDGVLKGS